MASTKAKTVQEYNDLQVGSEKEVCLLLNREISKAMGKEENKIWHGAPVWFLNGNPIVGYSKLKAGIKLMFWSGVDFGENDLRPGSGKYKDASITYTSLNQINIADLARWLEKGKLIQWDYKNIVKRRGVLVKIFPEI